MAQVHAPYHFVPLSKWVYMPDWAHLVSHDVPFENGLSGTIDYTLVNQTPLCVGQEHVKQDNAPTGVKWARDPQGNPIIPGSSIKGMLRSVLEIASFGKFGQVDERHFAERNISNSDSNYAKKISGGEVRSAWIKYNAVSECWEIRFCEHTKLFHNEFNREVEGGHFINQSHKQPARDKFKLYPLDKPKIRFDIEPLALPAEKKGELVDVLRACNFGKGKLEGIPVFSSYRPVDDEQRRKPRYNYSYVYYDIEPESMGFTNSSAIVNNLFKNNNADLVSYLQKNPHPEYGIPVFALVGKNNTVLNMGFAKMPRLTYDRSIKQLLKAQQPLNDSQYCFDMAELVFGTLRDRGFSLKSRVFFSDATSQNAQFQTTGSVVLGQPLASYLGAYLEQPNKDANAEVKVSDSERELAQYRDGDKLSGWKRYPAQPRFNEYLPSAVEKKVKVQSNLELVKPNAEFSGRLVFHNLKPQELGALIWVLRMGQTQDTQRHLHSLGHGRPLGAGGVSFAAMTVTTSNNEAPLQVEQISELMSSFTDLMESQCPATTGWQNSPQIRHMISFADVENNEHKNLTYMQCQKSKDPDVMTYSDSMAGRQKQVLPDWHNGKEVLPRKDGIAPSISHSKPLTEIVSAGRLSALIEEGAPENTIDADIFKKSALTEDIAPISSSKPDYVLRFEKLESELLNLNGKTDQDSVNRKRNLTHEVNALVIELTEKERDIAIATRLLALARNTALCDYLNLNRRKKAQLRERQGLLEALEKSYGVEYEK
ncbi:TIGR03986 family type III CRISPR-associated RAMP protein [Pseudoalteromonas rubra]|uniref:CRISPR type III-associated protein domain-containing protein n=1 Tax=Pseudoalteromonas rubra TaxID=43658 RepID=A0A0F4QGB0_9GAMM|nr:TIGR03986 family CRISPR-associated RAMP protein [Pseudoalteromonas rubra]KJZ06641.1 hypothetical protein TW77_18265 [Pseudoalteromonas rubra]